LAVEVLVHLLVLPMALLVLILFYFLQVQAHIQETLLLLAVVMAHKVQRQLLVVLAVLVAVAQGLV
jgi:hypothetical protein